MRSSKKTASNARYESLIKYIYPARVHDRVDKRYDKNKVLEKTNAKEELRANNHGSSNITDEDMISMIVEEVCKRLGTRADRSKNRQILKAAYRYRKNKRVVYIPKDPLINKVLEVLKSDPDEPLRVTIRKVFDVAALHLKIAKER